MVFALPAGRNIKHYVWTADCMHPLGFIEEEGKIIPSEMEVAPHPQNC